MPAKRYSMTSCSVAAATSSSSTTGELVDALEVDEERRRHVAGRPLAADVDVVVGNGPGAAVDDGLDDGVDVELVAVVGVVDAHPALRADERELAAHAAGQHGVASPDVADERGVVAVQPLLEHPAPRPQVAAVVVVPLVVAEGADAVEVVGRRIDQVGGTPPVGPLGLRLARDRGPAARRAARRGGSARRPAPCRWTAGGARRRRAARRRAAAGRLASSGASTTANVASGSSGSSSSTSSPISTATRIESAAVASVGAQHGGSPEDVGEQHRAGRRQGVGEEDAGVGADGELLQRVDEVVALQRPADRATDRRAPSPRARRGRAGRRGSGGGRRRRRGRPRGS